MIRQKDNTSDNGKNDKEFEVKEIENAMELKHDKVYYDVETKHQEENFYEDKLTHIKQKTNANIDTLSKIEDDDTATNSKIFSIRCASKTDYDQLAEIY